MKNFNSQITSIDLRISSQNFDYWEKTQRNNSLKIFHKVAQRVPAYKDFLKKNKISHEKVKSYEDFMNVPIINKKDYIKQYPLKDLCWDGTLDRSLVLTATSGSTGEPSYFVRDSKLDWQYSISIQRYLERSSYGRGSTLVIICFGMGIWIGGLITYKAYEIASNRTGYPVSLITPGINKKEIFSALKKLSPQYDQTILVGYAPFLKDIVDQSPSESIDLKELNIRFMFAAEALTEEVREYLYQNAGVKNVYRDFLNVYGSADIGAMAFEGALSILVKQKIKGNKKITSTLFSPVNKVPTLAQYNPAFINFEAVNSEILLTGDSAIPLVRYSIGDNGGVYTYDMLREKLMGNNINIEDEIVANKLSDCVSQLPFVYVYERMDFSTTLYGLNIYPEWVKRAIISTELARYLTGKFTLITKYDSKSNQYLEINVEQMAGVTIPQSFKKKAVHILVKHMMHYSSEFRELVNHLKERAYPRIEFWQSEDPLYFQPGIKQKWVK